MPAEVRVQGHTVVVVAGGTSPQSPLDGIVPAGATVIAADGGIDRALTLGLRIDLAIGDFDSASANGIEAAETQGARFDRHPAEKDATDLELALDAALALRPDRIVVIGDGGGRLDHLLSACLLLAADTYAAVTLDAYFGVAALHVIRGSRTITGTAGELVSLIPVHGRAEGVTTSGLAYPLLGEALEAGSSRGVSNVFAGSEATVTVERGVIVAVRPGESL